LDADFSSEGIMRMLRVRSCLIFPRFFSYTHSPSTKKHAPSIRFVIVAAGTEREVRAREQAAEAEGYSRSGGHGFWSAMFRNVWLICFGFYFICFNLL
jgi:hypothetical protein